MLGRVRAEAADQYIADKQYEAFYCDGTADDLPAARAVLRPYRLNIDGPDRRQAR
jgi:hypothetical protein